MNLAVKYTPIYDLFDNRLSGFLADSDRVEVIDGVEISTQLEECSAELVITVGDIRIEATVTDKLFDGYWIIGFPKLNINGIEFSSEELNSDSELLRMSVTEILRMMNRPIKRALN
jgi:hypothetical protein